jgi:hypothetical protein
MEKELIGGLVLIAIGMLFFFSNKNMGRGLAEFYKKIYTKKNVVIILRIVGIILVVGGFVLVFLK